MVVDNGSSDGSVARLRRDVPGIEVVVSGRNLGYGAAANRGVAATGAPAVLVCNPDVTLHPGALAAMTAALDAEPRRALVGPLIRDATGKRYPSARRFPSLLDAAGHALVGLFTQRNRFTRSYHDAARLGPDPGEGAAAAAGSDPRAVDWVSGACFLVRRAAFEQVGGFDEAYFMYMEDVDLCRRLGSTGWTVAYVPAAEVVHLQGASTDRRPYRMIAEHHRSLLRYAVHTTRGWRRLLLPLVALAVGARCGLACLVRAARVRSRPPETPDPTL